MWLSLPRPRLQFSIRTLLVLMFVAAIGAGWYGWRMRVVQMQEHAFLRMASKGALVLHYQEGAYISFGRPGGGLCGTGLIHVYGPGTAPVTFGDQELPLLEHVAVRCFINFDHSAVTAAGMQQLKQKHPDWDISTN